MLWHLLYTLLIGLAAGWLAGQIFKGRDFGLWGNMFIGVIGSFIGSFLFHLFGFHAYGDIARLTMAVVGSLVLLFGIQKLKS